MQPTLLCILTPVLPTALPSLCSTRWKAGQTKCVEESFRLDPVIENAWKPVKALHSSPLNRGHSHISAAKNTKPLFVQTKTSFTLSIALVYVSPHMSSLLPAPTPGSVYLSSHAILENPHFLPSQLGTIILNVLVLSSMPNTPLIICSLCYVKRDVEEENPTRFYSIYAKETHLLSIFNSQSSCHTQVVAFTPGIHTQSPNYKDNEIALMGDLCDVCIHFLSGHEIMAKRNLVGCPPCVDSESTHGNNFSC